MWNTAELTLCQLVQIISGTNKCPSVHHAGINAAEHTGKARPVTHYTQRKTHTTVHCQEDVVVALSHPNESYCCYHISCNSSFELLFFNNNTCISCWSFKMASKVNIPFKPQQQFLHLGPSEHNFCSYVGWFQVTRSGFSSEHQWHLLVGWGNNTESAIWGKVQGYCFFTTFIPKRRTWLVG